MKKLLFFALVIFAAVTFNSFSENVKKPENSASVDELFEYHEVIYQIWHEGWQQKDVKILQDALQDVEKGADRIMKAKLPGILRDKQSKWDAGLKELSKIVESYKKHCQKKDNKALFDDAEKLHAQFEKLVRIIKPSMKEMEDYHIILYSLYHYDMPDYKYSKIKESVIELNNKIKDLMKAPVPKSVATKEAKFNEARNELKSSLDELTKVVNAGDSKDLIKKMIEKMHSKYQALESVFD